MNSQSLHAHEDRLLDFAYGELPPLEARAVEAHLEGCTRCNEVLASIRGVRTTMAQLSLEPAPDTGLESLLAYSKQAARRAAAGPEPKPTWWRRWLVPAVGLAAVSVFGIVSLQVNQSVDLSPQLAAEKRAETKFGQSSPPPPPPSAQAPSAPQYEPEPEAAAVAAPPEPAPSKQGSSMLPKGIASRSTKKESISRRRGDDWSNAGSGGGFPEQHFDRAYDEQKSDERRDAMTQAGAFSKSKSKPAPADTGLTPPASPAPATAAAPPPARDEESDDSDALVAEAPAQQANEQPRSSLRVGGGSRGVSEPEPAEAMEDSKPQAVSEPEVEGSLALGESMASAGAPPSMVRNESPFDLEREQRSRRGQGPGSMASAAPAKTVKAPLSPAELSKQALMAYRAGDRALEVRLLHEALAAGATGSQRLDLLGRLCDAEFTLGRRQAALQACRRVVEEDPDSSAAQVARRRLGQEAQSASEAVPAKPVAPASPTPSVVK